MKESLLIFGDVCPAWAWRPLFAAQDPEALLSDVLPLVRSAKEWIINLECPATLRTERAVKTGPNLKAQPEDLQFLKALGVTAVSLANNHILDFGAGGLCDTMEQCDTLGLPYFGAGKDRNAAGVPYVCRIGRKRIGICSFAEEEFNCADENRAGANRFDPYQSYDDVRAAKAGCDYLIVLYHGGIEHYRYPSPLLQKKCRKFVASGADLVLCQHSHCIGTEERYENGRILYGQGNALFGHRAESKAWNEGLAVLLEADENGVEIRYIPLEATENGLRLGSGGILRELMQESEKISLPGFIEEQWQEFCRRQRNVSLPSLYARGRIFIRLNILTRGLAERLLHRNHKLAMNMVRCDAHREVVQTILETEFYGKKE